MGAHIGTATQESIQRGRGGSLVNPNICDLSIKVLDAQKIQISKTGNKKG